MTDTLGAYALDTIHCTDALTLLQGLPDNSVNCCVTSPPYFGLRDYGFDGQIGLEATPREYVEALVTVFRELRRVLREDGTFWLNLGDSYAANRSYQVPDGKWVDVGNTAGSRVPDGLKPKDLIGIPWRVAFALQDDGWYLRSDIIWSKPNPMPESVTDRPTKAHEYLFLLTKSASYWYDAEAIKEPLAESTVRIHSSDGVNPYGTGADWKQFHTGNGHSGLTNGNLRDGQRNKRSVWTIATQPYSGAHFAVMPEALVEPCVLAGCPETVCAVCGAPYVRQVERESAPPEVFTNTGASADVHTSTINGAKVGMGQKLQNWRADHPPRTLGFAPTCACNGGTTNGICLDPFGGAATVGVVAKRLNRRYLLSEINPAYVELARDRLAGVTPMFPGFAQVQS